ncbi:MAG TPA: BON domain-containing protein [Acidimicrobiia bacterium]|nr:BON domain-containing protein [Acidimicrobiia bacterium]
MRKLTTAASVAGGAIAAYLLDPDNGRARRARTKDQAMAGLRSLTETVSQKATYQRNVVEGWVHEAIGAIKPERSFDDATLLQKVRSEILGTWSNEGNPPVDVTVSDGDVALTTDLTDASARQALLRRVKGVEGVGEVTFRDAATGSAGARTH